MCINIESDFCSYVRKTVLEYCLFQFVKKCLHKCSQMIKGNTVHCRAVKARCNFFFSLYPTLHQKLV